MTRIRLHLTTALGLGLIVLGLGAALDERFPPIGPEQLPDAILASTTGATPSWKDEGLYNCKWANADRENDAAPPPNPRFVTNDNCKETVGSPPNERWKYAGNPCINCPTIGQSRKRSREKIYSGGLVGPVSQVNCQTPGMGPGTVGTCIGGVCVNPAVYNCTTRLDFFQLQSGPGGG